MAEQKSSGLVALFACASVAERRNGVEDQSSTCVETLRACLVIYPGRRSWSCAWFVFFVCFFFRGMVKIMLLVGVS